MRPQTIAGFVALLAAIVLPLCAAAGEPGVPAEDRAAIRNVISQQVEAFRRDDGPAAFSYAAPGIRRMTGSSEAFMEMVRRSYRPVYRPDVFEFGDIAGDDRSAIQRVFVVGPDGKAMEALYPMERQPDGRWLINGCILVAADSRAT